MPINVELLSRSSVWSMVLLVVHGWLLCIVGIFLCHRNDEDTGLYNLPAMPMSSLSCHGCPMTIASLLPLEMITFTPSALSENWLNFWHEPKSKQISNSRQSFYKHNYFWGVGSKYFGHIPATYEVDYGLFET